MFVGNVRNNNYFREIVRGSCPGKSLRGMGNACFVSWESIAASMVSL